MTYLRHARNVPLDINAGSVDGHSHNNPVLPTHSALLFNQVARPGARFNESELQLIASGKLASSSTSLVGGAPAADPAYPTNKPVLLRRVSGAARLTVFAGGHETLFDTGLRWLEVQRRNRTHHWSVGPPAYAG